MCHALLKTIALVSVLAMSSDTPAYDAQVTARHGLSMYGDLKYALGFETWWIDGQKAEQLVRWKGATFK
jgi:hypothetical protein